MREYGLIGYPLSHSFSESYFNNKFKKENIPGVSYRLYPLQSLDELPELLRKTPDLGGLNVTIPYKEQVISMLDEVSGEAQKAGAVNCIKIEKGRLTGYNTDIYGFEKSLKPLLGKKVHNKALVLGSGGASKAVRHVLERLGIKYKIVSRAANPSPLFIQYEKLTPAIVKAHKLIINTTPLGTYPETDTAPGLPYTEIDREHLLYDLVYNPVQTLFMKKGLEQGAQAVNGRKMLELQAEKSWEIWRKP